MAIINQSNILNLQPGITAPVVVHMSEGDVGTKLSFKLIDGARAWTDPGNVVAAVHGRRQDGTQFGPYACTISGDVVSFETDAAIAAVAGSGIAELVLTDSNGNTAGTSNFAILVERATFPMGVTYMNDKSVYEAILRYVQTIPAQVTGNLTAKINAVQSGLNAEIAERTTHDAVLSARMDQFTRLPDGKLSTAADAELVDIRVKADGTKASTAGNAVREQFTELRNDLDDVIGIDTGIYWITGERVSLSTDDGYTAGQIQPSVDPLWQRTNYIDLSYVKSITVVHTQGTHAATRNAWYDKYKNPLSTFAFQWKGTRTIIPPSSAAYAVLSCDANDDLEITLLHNSIKDILNESNEKVEKLVDVSNFYNADSWEIGTITSQYGTNTDNANLYRTKSIVSLPECRIFVDIGYRWKIFKYNASTNEYIGTEDWQYGNKPVLVEEGSYRFIVGKNPAATVVGDEYEHFYLLGEYAYDIESNKPVTYAHGYNGEKISIKRNTFDCGFLYNIPWRSGYSNQGIDAFSGSLFVLWNDAHVSLINVDTGALITDYAISCGHGNACQFSSEYYDSSDEFPLLYCYDYSENKVHVNRVTRQGATLIRTYRLPIDGYRVSGGVDGIGQKLITVHYKIDSSTIKSENGCILSVWDLVNTTEENGMLVPTLISEVSIPFIATIQDCKYYRGCLYITSGYWNTYNVPLAIHAFNTNGICVTELRDFPDSMIETDNSESEGLAFYDDGEKIRILYAMHAMYEIVVS